LEPELSTPSPDAEIIEKCLPGREPVTDIHVRASCLPDKAAHANADCDGVADPPLATPALKNEALCHASYKVVTGFAGQACAQLSFFVFKLS
jgi:hypothetical protein